MNRSVFPTALILIITFTLFVVGCTATDDGTPVPNRPPTVWLSGAPPEGTTSKYTIQLFWGGWDPDGEIAHYEYCITDNEGQRFNPADTAGVDKWHTVVGNDSIFTFTADVLADTNSTNLVTEFTRSHTFFVRAVDREGARSIEPAYRSFTARTLSPEVNIQIPRQAGLNPALVPPIATFRWTARDFVDDMVTIQDPDSVQVAVVKADAGYTATINWMRTDPAAEDEWGPWMYYRAPNDSGKFYTTPPLDLGPYIFAIRAKDEAGAITPVLDEAHNVRRLRVSQRATGPILTVSNQYLGTVMTSICSTPVTIMDLPAGVPIEFCWSADAESYGGLVSGYRYGWDIGDVNDPDQWEVDYTPFTSTRACVPEPRQFFFGLHVFTVEVIDNSGFCSRVEIKVNIVQFTFNEEILVVDDFQPDHNNGAGWNGSDHGILPNDAEHDAFWLDMLSHVQGFDPGEDVIEVDPGSEIRLDKVANYKSIIWSVYSDKSTRILDNLPLFYQFTRYRPKNPTGTSGGSAGKIRPNVLALFMAAGGKVLITGTHPVANVINRSLAPSIKYPLIFLYELEGEQEGTPDIAERLGDESFGYLDLCVDVLDFSELPERERRNASLYCPMVTDRGTNENFGRDHTMREAYPLDENFPRLVMRMEAAGAGKAYHPSARGIDTEIYNPHYFFDSCEHTPSQPRDCFQPIYGLVSLDTAEPTYRQPIAFWTSQFADRVPDGIPGAQGARSVVFGFPLVYFDPGQVREALEYIFFEEWQLPRRYGE